MKRQQEKFVENLIQALKNPTRASIFYQLAKKPESTATEISRNLGENADVVYYHLKLLGKAGLISEPRVVVRGNYLEKYYSLRRDFKDKLLQSIEQLTAKEKELSVEEFREMVITLFTVVQSILTNSIKRLKKADSRIIEKIRKEDSIESKIIFCTKKRYNQMLSTLREASRSTVLETFDPIEKEYVITVIAIPKLGKDSN